MHILAAGCSPSCATKVICAQRADFPIYDSVYLTSDIPQRVKSQDVECGRHTSRLSCAAAACSPRSLVGHSFRLNGCFTVIAGQLISGNKRSKQFWRQSRDSQAEFDSRRFCVSSSQVHFKRVRGCRSTLNQNSWAMPEDNEVFPPGEETGSSVLDSASFLASLMPKKEIGAHKFLEENPLYDGRGVIVAIFDSGVDPAAAGLQTTTDGKPKLVDVVDCTGSGDVDTSTLVKADENGLLVGASGAKLRVNKTWKNPSGDWRVGSKFAYQLFTDTLVNRLKKERKKKWIEQHREALTKALRQLTEFDMKHPRVSNIAMRKEREDLQTRIDLLQKVADSYDDKGPVIDAVVWHDGEVWRVALDTQDMEDEGGEGKLVDFTPLTNYRIEHKCGVFSKMDACSFVTNVYDGGNILSIVTDSSPHGTHVAGIAAAHHPEEPLLNGVAPGAQLVSCKIGDSRLGSMETGTGLTRALITAIENNCDLINMSYGEPTMIPNHGRFVELVNEVVEKHGVIFVSSAGNSGPSLSTVGAPGGTTSNILGIGAFVSPGMAAAAHSIVEPPSEGLPYTWSSRGPTTDGDLGVCLSAPGGAVAPVPMWTLQRRMLMNGTSMASPCACGGIALVLSGLKAEGQRVSPNVVRKALENTASPLSTEPEALLTTGRGLLQVDRAYEYLRKCTGIPSVSYEVQVGRSSTNSRALRGIYLREWYDFRQPSEWTVQVKPKFHENADKLRLLVPFEEHVQLESSASWVKVPEYLLLTNNGRIFNVMVDPTSLKDGVHYTEVIGLDTGAPWRGPLFRVPITLVKPMEVAVRPPAVSFQNLVFTPGHIERKFIAVPDGATWAEAVFHVSGFDTPRRFFISAVQIIKEQRPSVWESVVAFSSPTLKAYSFAIQGGLTMELCVAQFWSSGIGSLVSTGMEIQVKFHGLQAGEKEIFLHGTEGSSRVDVKAPLSMERLSPTAALQRVRMPFRPVESKLVALSAARDMFPVGRQISALTLTYKFTLTEGGKIKPSFPFLNNRIYEAEFESQLYIITDVNKRVVSTGDCYPKGVKLSKGEYTLRVHIRHDNISYLEKLKRATAFIDRTLDDKSSVKLSFYSHMDGAVTGKDVFRALNLLPGESWPFYVAAPADEKLPKDALVGTLLIGKITFGTEHINEHSPCPSSLDITYNISPAFKAEEKGKDKNNFEVKKTIAEKIEEEVRDAKIKLLSSISLSTSEDRKDWEDLVTTLKAEYPKHLQLFVDILQTRTAASTQEDEQIIEAANDVISLIDTDGLAIFFSMKSEAETVDAAQVKKEMETQRDALAEALYKKGLSLANLEEKRLIESSRTQRSKAPENGGAPWEGPTAEDKSSEKSDLIGGEAAVPMEDLNGIRASTDTFRENFTELRKWADTSSPKYGLLTVRSERRAGRLGTALKVLNDLIQDESKPPQKDLYEMRASLIEEIGWIHWSAHDRKLIAFLFPSAYPLF